MDPRCARLLTLEDTVEFFNLILGTKLTAEEKQDLVQFLRARYPLFGRCVAARRTMFGTRKTGPIRTRRARGTRTPLRKQRACTISLHWNLTGCGTAC